MNAALQASGQASGLAPGFAGPVPAGGVIPELPALAKNAALARGSNAANLPVLLSAADGLLVAADGQTAAGA